MSRLRYRTGTKNRRVIYLQQGDQPEKSDPMVGAMDTPELGTRVAELLNEHGGPEVVR